MIAEIDSWIAEGRFKSRSDAIKTIISLYEEREKTRKFYERLNKRSEEAKKNPEKLVPLVGSLGFLVFKVLFHPTAAKELRKLDSANQARMKKALGELSSDPFNLGKTLHPSNPGA